MTVTLIVMEPGGAWPGHVGRSEDVVALSYESELLLTRTRQRLEALRESRQEIRIAVLSCRDTADLKALELRSQLAHELLSEVSASGFGRLILSAADGASTQLRRQLLSLAGVLSYELRGTTTTVSLKFGDGARRARVSRERPTRFAYIAKATAAVGR
jgi:hypothetical protein